MTKKREIDPELNVQKVNDEFKKSQNKAQEMINNPEESQEKIKKAAKKAEKHKGQLDAVWHHLQLMFKLVKAYFKGDYKKVSIGTIVAILGGIIYFVSPVDAIPDVIPVIGLIDDVFVLGVVISQVNSELKKFEAWLQTAE